MTQCEERGNINSLVSTASANAEVRFLPKANAVFWQQSDEESE
jgi:hypothetical protein